MNYRAEIDGLRALAVIPVILYHAGFDIFSGGYIGVDIFFVISGYLITTILIEDIENDRFSILGFYARRARRILPALFVMMMVCIPLAWMWMLPDPLENFGQSLVATTLSSNNVLLIFTTGYWTLASEFKPLLHTWSLGVEEQFYLVFPIMLILIWRFAKSYLLAIIVLLFIASFITSEYIGRDYPNANYYFIVTRAWELLAGSLVAMFVLTYGIKSNNLLSVLGIAAIVFAIFVYNERTPFPSAYTLVPVIGVALVIQFADSRTMVARLLSNRLLIGIGLISYSAYLWHQPLLAFAKIYKKVEPGALLNGSLVISTFFIAYISWRYVETPFRRTERVSNARFACFAAICAIGISAFGYSAHYSHGFISRKFDESSKAENLYNAGNVKFKADEFVTDNAIKLLVVGNSFGRDVINVVRQTYTTAHIDIVYRDDVTHCSILQSPPGSALYEEAHVVLFAMHYETIDPACIDSLVEKSSTQNSDVFFVGTKHFGFNMNWIARVGSNERALLRNVLLPEAALAEASALRHIPPDNYISILDILVDDENRVLVTDEFGRLLSGDRVHLTKYGALYVGREVFLPSALTAALNKHHTL